MLASQVGRDLQDSGDQGDVDEGEKPLKARLPRPAVEQHGDASSSGCAGQRDREVKVVTVDEHRVHAVHERRRPVRCVRATVGNGTPVRGFDRDDRALPGAARHQHGGDGGLIQRTGTINHVDTMRGQVCADQGAQGRVADPGHQPRTDPECGSGDRRVGSGPARGDQQLAGHELLVGTREALNGLLHVEHRDTAREHLGHDWEVSGAMSSHHGTYANGPTG